MSRDMSRDMRNNGVKIQQGVIHLLSVISDGYGVENTAMQSIYVVHCNAISFDYYGIEIVKLKSKRPSAKQATD